MEKPIQESPSSEIFPERVAPEELREFNRTLWPDFNHTRPPQPAKPSPAPSPADQDAA